MTGVDGTPVLTVLLAVSLVAVPARAAATRRERELEKMVRALSERVEALESAQKGREAAAREPAAARESSELEDACVELERDQWLKIVDHEKKLSRMKGRAEAGPSNKGFSITSNDGKYKARVGARLQELYQGQNYDTLGAPNLGLTGKDGFFVRRLKIYMDGHLGSPRTTYRWQFEAARTQGILDDAFIEHLFTSAFKVRLGQFKTPTSRQVIESTRDFIFTERALASLVFAFNNPGIITDARDIIGPRTHGVGRNAGIQLWGDVDLKKSAAGDRDRTPMVRYFQSIFNGSGQNLANENAGLEYVGRLELHPLGDFGYVEGSLDQPERPWLVFDVGHIHDSNQQRIELDGAAGITRNDREDRNVSNLGVGFRWRKVSLLGEYFRQWTEPEGTLTRNVLIPIPGVGSRGWYYQLGYVLRPRRMELAFRDGAVDPDRAVRFNHLRETGACLNYYLEGHPHALQLELLRLTDDAAPLNDHTRTRLQYELTF